jgi:YrbI family 3-deoxy-D-manno-octulosonate 8-phosphate phosphatase
MKIIVIPARKRSKGIADKNLQKINGISLVERSIKIAKLTSADLIILTSDSDIILNFGRELNVVTHLRSENNSDDFASTESVVLEIISDLGVGWPRDSVIGILQPTSPFIRPDDIEKCFVSAGNGNSAFTSQSFHGFIWEKKDIWEAVNHPSNFRPRRQELNSMVVESGFYAFQINLFKNNPYRFCSNVDPIVVDSVSGLEIDTIEDLELCRVVAKYYDPIPTHLMNLPRPRIIFTDFDGCLTDDRVIVNSNSTENVIANRKDGLAIRYLQEIGIETIIISSEKNNIVNIRAEKLNIKSFIGVENKFKIVSEYLKTNNIRPEEVWYVGNDLNDKEVMRLVGLTICPADSTREIIQNSDIVLKTKGGAGIFSEILSRVK